jgi:hypothetical protein
MKRLLIGLALLRLPGIGFGQEMRMVKVKDLVWKEHPVFKGAQTVFLIGDPMKAETIVQRVKFPPNYRVPATHASVYRSSNGVKRELLEFFWGEL